MQEMWNYCESDLYGSSLELYTEQGTETGYHLLVDTSNTVTNVDLEYTMGSEDPLLLQFEYSIGSASYNAAYESNICGDYFFEEVL